MKGSPRLYRLFNGFFALGFAGLFLICLLRHDNPFLPLGRPQLALVFVLGMAAAAAAAAALRRFEFAQKRVGRLLAAGFVLLFCLQLWFGLQLQVGFAHAWDYALVARTARDFVLQGAPPGGYFTLFSNNGPLFWLYAGYFSLLHLLFGVENFVPAMTVLNALAIDTALFCLYRAARRLWGVKNGLAVLAAGALHPALWLYLPVAYTDTLTLPFVCGAAAAWLRARAEAAVGRLRPAVAFAAGAFALVGAGAALKISVAILAVAFVIDLAVFWGGRRRQRLAAGAAALACFGVVLGGLRGGCAAALPPTGAQPIPYTHWIMMGLHGNGGYWDPDYQLTLQYDSLKERQAFTRAEIGRRLRQMGPGGLAAHCVEKLAYIFSDGCCFAPEKLCRDPLADSPLRQLAVPGGRFFGLLAYGADGLQLCLLALCGLGGAAAARRGAGQMGTVFRVAVFGLALFLLIWEARSRYLVNFLPLFFLCAAEGVRSLPRWKRGGRGEGEKGRPLQL